MSEKELVEKRSALENRRAQLRSRYEELNAKFRASRDEIEGYKVQADILNVSRALSDVEDEIRQLDTRLRGFKSDAYEKKHESAILAGALTMERHLNELRSTLLEGKAPESAGIAGRPMPLPPEEAERAKQALNELEKEILQLKDRFAYNIDESPSIMLTYMWASILLGKMEGTIQSLRPAYMEKSRGPMRTEYKIYLEEVLPSIERRVIELRKKYTTARET